MIPRTEPIVLDTSILVALIRASEVGRRVDADHGLRNRTERPTIAIVTVGELRSWARKLDWGTPRQRRLDELVSELTVIGQVGTTIGLGLLFDTLVIRAFMTPSIAALLERPGTALSKAQLEERLYGWGEEVESNAVEVHVHNLRKKLGADAIRTIRGVGYVIARA